MEVKKLNKTILQQLRVDMNVALRTVSEKYGLDTHIGNASYRDLEANLKLKVSILDVDGGNKQGRADFILYGECHGFDAEDFGKVFTADDGKSFKIIGWNRRRRKYPVECTAVKGGKIFDFMPRTVLRALGKAGNVVSSFSTRG